MLNALFHDRHADASAGVQIDLLGGGQPLCKDQLASFNIRELGGIFVGQQAALDSTLFKSFRDDAAAVIFDRDESEAVRGTQFYDDAAFLTLAEEAALIGRFDAVYDGISEQMEERFDESVDEQRVDLDIAVFDGKCGELSFFLTGYVDRAIQTCLKSSEPLHADTTQIIDQCTGDLVSVEKDLGNAIGIGLGATVAELGKRRFEHLVVGCKFRGELYQIVEPLERNANDRRVYLFVRLAEWRNGTRLWLFTFVGRRVERCDRIGKTFA